MVECWDTQSVLVTGASGFIGSRLVEALVQLGFQVVALIRSNDPQSQLVRSGALNRIHVINGDLEDPKVIERAILKYKVGTIYHLGAQTQVTHAALFPIETFETNIKGTYYLLESCRKMRHLVKRIIIASSDKVYGETTTLPISESQPLSAVFPYDVSKACQEQLALSYHKTYKLPIALARASNVYGGGDFNWDRLIPGVVRSLFYNQCPIIRSDGSFTRDYLYIDDIVNAYLHLGRYFYEKNISGIAFNFGTGKPETVMSICEKISDVMGKKKLTPRIQNFANAEIQDQYLSIEKAEKELGWSPVISLEKGLEQTVSWYRQYFMKLNLDNIREQEQPLVGSF